MKQALAVVLSLFVCLTLCSAQTTDKPKLNAISFELGKTGLIYNLNFDHKLANGNFGFRFSIGSNFSKYLNFISIGGGGYALIGKQKQFLELGFDIQYLIVDETSDDQRGFSFVYPDYSIKTLYPGLNIGYRRYGRKNLFRVGITPGLINSKLIPGGYISYGIGF